jgi:hypothetical protein
MMNRKYALLLGLTMELVALELGLIYAGSWADQKLGWPGYGVMIGAFVGFSMWVLHLVIALKSDDGDELK